ncbi:unnamed protein product [Adineta ricciae]|uniref:B box-type domain-containing protein n=1 Tax=Adineta ricciae TaxID=249248 RepID=A0A814CK29_ADIRI|nr:unnamed protein product [Adineta ricciae]
MSRRGLTKFDTTFLTNDGGKYSPSIRRLRQQYLPETKKTSSPRQPSNNINSIHHQSSLDIMTTPLKCDDCQKHDGLFQCCHCNQRLCIRCCNKHYKKVTAELEYLHELSDCLLTKILHTKTDLERQKNETIEQCHQWRIDTMNTINKAHALIIQTIQDEYEVLSKEYDLFVEKEMQHIKVDKNELMRMKKGNLGSLLSSPTMNSSPIDPTQSIGMIKKRIETFAKYMDDAGKFHFQVKLPTFSIDEKLRVESHFGDMTRSTSATWQNDEFIYTASNELIDSSTPDLPPTNHRCDSTSSSADSAYSNQDDDCLLKSVDQRKSSSSSSTLSIDQTNDDTYYSIQQVHLNPEQDGSSKGSSIQLEKSHRNDGIVDQEKTSLETVGVGRKPLNKGRSSDDYPWFYYQHDLSSSYIQ